MFWKLIQATLLDYRNIWIKCSVVTNRVSDSLIDPGAIIGDGDGKRAPFLVLGLAPGYGTIFLFLEQVAPSPATHARTCWEDFLRMSLGKNGVRNSRNHLCLWPTTHETLLWLLEFC